MQNSLCHGESRSTLVGKIVDSLTNNFVVNLFFRFRFEKDHIAHYQKEEQKANYVATTLYCKNVYLFIRRSCRRNLYSDLVHGFLLDARENLYGGSRSAFLYDMEFVAWSFGLSQIAPEFFQSLGIAKQALSVMQDPQDILDPSHAVDLSD